MDRAYWESTQGRVSEKGHASMHGAVQDEKRGTKSEGPWRKAGVPI